MQLHQQIPITADAKRRSQQVLTEVYHALQRAETFTGMERTYAAYADDGDRIPPEKTHVRAQAQDLIDQIKAPLIARIDAVNALDTANANAQADIVLADGTVIAREVPATVLVQLEKQLNDLRTTISAIPTLPNDTIWTARQDGTFEAEPTTTIRNLKTQVAVTLAAATDKHPANVQLVQKDVAVGEFTTRKLSGAMPIRERKALLARLETLQSAVKVARAAANNTLVPDQPAVLGKSVVQYILGTD